MKEQHRGCHIHLRQPHKIELEAVYYLLHEDADEYFAELGQLQDQELNYKLDHFCRENFFKSTGFNIKLVPNMISSSSEYDGFTYDWESVWMKMSSLIM